MPRASASASSVQGYDTTGTPRHGTPTPATRRAERCTATRYKGQGELLLVGGTALAGRPGEIRGARAGHGRRGSSRGWIGGGGALYWAREGR